MPASEAVERLLGGMGGWHCIFQENLDKAADASSKVDCLAGAENIDGGIESFRGDNFDVAMFHKLRSISEEKGINLGILCDQMVKQIEAAERPIVPIMNVNVERKLLRKIEALECENTQLKELVFDCQKQCSVAQRSLNKMSLKIVNYVKTTTTQAAPSLIESPPMSSSQALVENKFALSWGNSATPLAKSAIPLAKSPTPLVMPPTPLVMPPTPLVMPPTRLAKPPTRLAKPPTRLVMPPTRLVMPPTRLVMPPTCLAKSPTRLVMPPTRLVMPPTCLVMPPTRLAKSPTPLAMPPTPLAKSPTRLAKPPTRLAKPPTPPGVSASARGKLAPTASEANQAE